MISGFSDQIEDSAHEILLSSSVTPIVTFKSIKNVFLGKPFSPNCIPSFATNNYTVYEKPRSKAKRLKIEITQFLKSNLFLTQDWADRSVSGKFSLRIIICQSGELIQLCLHCKYYHSLVDAGRPVVRWILTRWRFRILFRSISTVDVLGDFGFINIRIINNSRIFILATLCILCLCGTAVLFCGRRGNRGGSQQFGKCFDFYSAHFRCCSISISLIALDEWNYLGQVPILLVNFGALFRIMID